MTTLLYISLVITIVLIDFKYKRYKALKNVIDSSDQYLLKQLPIGSKIHWSKYTGNKCLRCIKGKIVRRYRFKVIGGNKNEKSLHGLRGVYWCDGCNYRCLATLKSEGERQIDGEYKA